MRTPLRRFCVCVVVVWSSSSRRRQSDARQRPLSRNVGRGPAFRLHLVPFHCAPRCWVFRQHVRTWIHYNVQCVCMCLSMSVDDLQTYISSIWHLIGLNRVCIRECVRETVSRCGFCIVAFIICNSRSFMPRVHFRSYIHLLIEATDFVGRITEIGISDRDGGNWTFFLLPANPRFNISILKTASIKWNLLICNKNVQIEWFLENWR